MNAAIHSSHSKEAAVRSANMNQSGSENENVFASAAVDMSDVSRFYGGSRFGETALRKFVSE